jgi:ribosomal protein L22
VSPENPQDPQKGKPFEDVQAAQQQREAEEAMAKEREAESPEPRPQTERAQAAPQAEGTAAEQTGVDKAGADAALEAETSEEPKAAPADDAPDEDAATPAEKPSRRRRREAEPAAGTPAAAEPGPVRRRDRRTPAAPGVTVRAQARYVRTSARKARLVCDHIRGKDVNEARAILAFTPRGAATAWRKLLDSAIANAEHNHELVAEDLKIAAAFADEGPTLKRFRPRAMGRATRIRRRTSHLTITLTPKES